MDERTEQAQWLDVLEASKRLREITATDDWDDDEFRRVFMVVRSTRFPAPKEA